MITVIRKGMQSKMYRIFLIIIVLALAGVFSLPELLKLSFGTASWVMKINNRTISHHEYAAAVNGQQSAIDMFRSHYGQNADLFAQLMGINLDPYQLASEKLIRDSLLNQIAHQMSLVIHDDYMASQLINSNFMQQEFPELMIHSIIGSHGIDMNRLRIYLKNNGKTIQDFEKQVEDALARSMALYAAMHASYTVRFETAHELNNFYAKKKFSYIKLPISHFIPLVGAIAEEDLQKFFDRKNNTGNNYSIPEYRQATRWTIAPSAYDAIITDDEIKSYYNVHKVRIFIDKPAMVEIKRMVFSNEQEAIAARNKYIKDPTLFDKQAEHIPAFAKNTHEKSLEQAAFLLRNDGDFSPVFHSNQGFQIIKRVRRYQPVYKALESVYDDIKSNLLHEKFKKLFQTDMDKLRQQGGTERAWTDFIQSKKDVKKTVSDKIKKADTPLARTLFSLAVGQYTFFMDNGSGVIIRLDHIYPKHTPSLSTIRKQVASDFQEEQAAQLLEKKLTEIKNSLVSISLSDLARELGTSVVHTGWIAESDTQEMKNMHNQEIPIAQMIQLDERGAKKVFTDPQAGYVVQLDEVALPSMGEIESNSAAFFQKKYQEISHMETQAFIASLFRNATIKLNEHASHIPL